MTTHRTTLLTLGLVALAASPGVAMAQTAPRRDLTDARAALRAYDTRDGATTDAIRALGEIAREARGRDGTEARFLRAVASADLLLIADRRDDPDLAARVAEAVGCAPEALRATLRAEFTALAVEPFRETTEDALAALGEPPAGLRLPSREPSHTRRQAVFFTRVFDRLLASDDPAPILSALAADPCADNAPCADVYRHFGPRGRRVIAGMAAVHEVLGALERTAELGDPFSAALAREVLVDAVLLRDMAVTPSDWAGPVASMELDAAGAVLDADAVIILAADHVRVGFVPRVVFEGGAPALRAEGAPLIANAQDARLPIAADADSSTRPLEGLAEHLAAHLSTARRIALLIEPGVPAQLLSETLASLEVAGIEAHALGGAGVDGTALGVAFRAVHGDGDAPVGVVVRPGGFSVRTPEGSVSLPRLRVGDRWRFDMVGLDRATAQRAEHAVSLRYMGTVQADLVMRVALLLASDGRPVLLALP